jgi:pimeloyl-ACP methyl ester carboxylesterase
MQRRELLKGLAIATSLAAAPRVLDAADAATTPQRENRAMSMIKAADGTELFVKDWGRGRPLLFVHSWAVTNDVWQYQHAHFAESGYRVVAFDRRGHGRSEQPGGGYDFDTLADDLARVIAARDLDGVTLIGHSMGCNEIVRYLARHGSARIARIILVAPTTPFLLKTAGNPEGVDGHMFEALRTGWKNDFPKWLRDNSRAFFVPETSQAMVDWGVTMMSLTPVHIAIACNKTMVETDFRPDCRAVSVPSLIVHGTADASAPLPLTGQRTAALIPHGRFSVYEGAPHGLMFTHMDRLHADIADFIAST